MIPNLSIGDLTIDCANPERARDFYADLLGYEKTVAYGCHAVRADNGMLLLFAQTDIPYEPPVWPEAEGKQQKQMHLDFSVRDFAATVEKAIRLGAAAAAVQYGGGFVTMIDTEGHPFCLSERDENKTEKSEFDLYFENNGYGEIQNISLNIDCQVQKNLRGFYAQMTGWDAGFHFSSLIAGNGMIICFQGCDNDATMDEYVPPVWPEVAGKQQKQMHFNFQVDDLPSAVDEAVRAGAVKTADQYGGDHFVTMIDTDGHPFCLCRR
jgi:Lactoylglutathione lyase and related lyases